MPRESGLSLLELLIAMTLLVVLAGIAAPGFESTLRGKEGELALRLLATQISLARTSAIEQGKVVTLCPSADGITCSGTWSSGNIVFTDGNANRQIDEDDLLIRSSLLTDMSGRITWRAFQNRQYLQIDSMGLMRHQSGNFTYCAAGNDDRLARQLVVNAAGRVRLAVDADGDGVREDSSGEPLRCD